MYSLSSTLLVFIVLLCGLAHSVVSSSSSSSTAAATNSSSSTAAAAGGSSSSSAVTSSSAAVASSSSTGASSSTGSIGAADYVITLGALGSTGCTQSPPIASAYQINGVAQPALTMNVGTTKTFQSSGIAGLQFAITTDVQNTGASSTGVITGTTLMGDATFSWTPTTAGTYQYICTQPAHNCMGNTITVTEASASTSSGANSASTIKVSFSMIVFLGVSVLTLFLRQ